MIPDKIRKVIEEDYEKAVGIVDYDMQILDEDGVVTRWKKKDEFPIIFQNGVYSIRVFQDGTISISHKKELEDHNFCPGYGGSLNLLEEAIKKSKEIREK